MEYAGYLANIDHSTRIREQVDREAPSSHPIHFRMTESQRWFRRVPRLLRGSTAWIVA